jgi:hypothetical protein
MGTVRTDEFCKDAVRIALTSGLSRKQIADDLGAGLSTLSKWITFGMDRSNRRLDVFQRQFELIRVDLLGFAPEYRLFEGGDQHSFQCIYVILGKSVGLNIAKP